MSAEMKETCPVCHDDIGIYAVGPCDHPICYKCSTRMRCLCDQLYCAICRADLPKVLFLERNQKYDSIEKTLNLNSKKDGIYFESEKLVFKYNSLLSHKCKICPKEQLWRTFIDLERHMRREHNLHYCEICISNLKIFSSERRCYSREKLAEHKRVGDVDDKSFKGHPLCELCDQRYPDRDDLARHCRKEHFHCHFCETDGRSLEFYGDYNILRDHFAEEHYLCEEGECYHAQFTNAFRSDIDFQAHRATVHCKSLTKSEARQARIIEVDIRLVQRPSQGRGRGRNRNDYDRGGGSRQDYHDDPDQRRQYIQRREEYHAAQAVAQHLNEMHRQSGAIALVDRSVLDPKSGLTAQSDSSEPIQNYHNVSSDFPTLGAKADSSEDRIKKKPEKDTLAKKLARNSNFSVQDGSMEEADFPSLGGGKKAKTTAKSGVWKGQPDVSDFPALSSQHPNSAVSKPAKNNVPVLKNWTVSNSKPTKSKSQKTATFSIGEVSQPSHSSQNNYSIPSVSDFPSLSTIGNSLLGSISSSSASLIRSSSAAAIIQNNGTQKKRKEFAPPSKHGSMGHDDFPTLGGTKPVEVNKQWGNKPKNDNKENVKSSRKQPAPMPDFSSESRPSSSQPEWQTVGKSEKKTEMKKPAKKSNDNMPIVAKSETKKQANKHNSNSPTEIVGKSSPDVDSNLDMKKSSMKKKDKSNANNSQIMLSKTSKKKNKSNNSLENNTSVITSEESDATNNNLAKVEEKSNAYIPPKVEMALNDFPSLSELSNSSSVVDNIMVNMDDFPALGNAKVSKPPPGFTNKHPPPGFKSTTFKPPPGFKTPATENIENIAPAIDKKASYTYTQPADFQDRNHKLILDIQEMLSPDEFAEFKSCSLAFRQDQISATAYYKKCCEIMGKQKFDVIFHELVSLLPDISKQQELLTAHNANLKGAKDVKTGKRVWNSVSLITCCATCGQVILSKELDSHLSQHSVESDFPTLSSIGASLT